MVRPRWSDFSSVFHTLREIDIGAIREESEQSITIACYGPPALVDTVQDVLLTDVYLTDEWSSKKGSRYAPVGSTPLVPAARVQHAPGGADQSAIDMLLLVVDGKQALSSDAQTALEELRGSTLPFLIVLLHSEELTASGPPELAPLADRVVTLPDPTAAEAVGELAAALLARLPAEMHLAAARRLPGVRFIVAQDLINNTSFSNGTYALLSGFSEQFPVMNFTIAAADMLILTKNQVMMVYKLALAHGAPPDFQACLREVVSVVGLGYLWRQAARRLVELIPVVGVVPKVAVAYSGTYAVGIASWRWFALGELVAREKLQQIAQEARERSVGMIDQMRARLPAGANADPDSRPRSSDAPRLGESPEQA